ncbi:MAG: hypothetical protein GC154_21395 [bacterium]|nr:hypothetical protein [bacterium]
MGEYRVLRALFVALGVGLAWGIRGDFGSVLGAMYPGAILGLGFVYVAAQPSLWRWAPVVGMVSALGISAGGEMSYGILHGYAKSDTFINYTYGFFTLFCEGGSWGCFGGAAVGLLLENRRMKAAEFFSLLVAVLVGGWAFQHLVVDVCGFHVNPPRSDVSVGYLGGVIAMFIWLRVRRFQYGLRGAFFGFLGFGLGMSAGRFLANASYLQPLAVNHWNIMEVMCGVIGGFVFTAGMLGKRFDDLPEEENDAWLNLTGAFFVMSWIPIMHRLNRIPASEKIPEWTERLTGWGYENAAFLAQLNMGLINAVCVLSLMAAAAWAWMHFKRPGREPWFPVMALSLIMVLIQNLNALYLFYPVYQGINMHNVFWVLLALMALYIWLGPKTEFASEDDDEESFPWVAWTASALVIFALILALSAVVNGEETMKSANTRFPLWSWKDGVK